MAKIKSQSFGQVRIIGGQWRGRKLNFPVVESLRPTGDRIRETLFNWLQVYLPSSRCLDLFSGSGALGFEAASRGASQVDMVESNKAVQHALLENIRLLDAQNCQVHQMTAEAFVHSVKRRYDIIFIDPPFKGGYWLDIINLIDEQQLIVEGGRIYIETPKKLELKGLPARWQLLREKKAGDVKYSLFEYLSGTESS